MADAQQLPTATAGDLEAAHAEPVLRLGQLVYRGRLLSIEEWLPHFERRLELERQLEADRAAKRVPNLRPWIDHWVAYLRAVFPRRRFRIFAPDPVAAIRALPGNGLRENYERFFLHQALALGLTHTESLATKSGTSSGGSTPDRGNESAEAA